MKNNTNTKQSSGSTVYHSNPVDRGAMQESWLSELRQFTSPSFVDEIRKQMRASHLSQSEAIEKALLRFPKLEREIQLRHASAARRCDSI